MPDGIKGVPPMIHVFLMAQSAMSRGRCGFLLGDSFARRGAPSRVVGAIVFAFPVLRNGAALRSTLVSGDNGR